MSTFAIETLIAEARRDISDADRCVALHISPAVHQLHRRLREVTDALTVAGSADWRVLGGVIPGPIPVEWVRVGDTIQDHGYEGEVTGVRDPAPGARVVECGHVSFAKVKRQDFVYVTGTSHENGSQHG